uniref:START domain-containing protein n=1 Tax=Tetraselmis sp. GSL018 TaxID=582737 RepID=A0A061SNA8_9CHLO|mmetsp:Transcript_35344/g.83843  ORF Transcript_35344/g.83843 Transcript_35344/m.83843 type:complete len:241 (+) Transcript_35344:142-864(+)|eukprot:CAMPEP_0177580484 /NCGR_PEP_ID=MMETSP0419_2-20121207/1587_1 /TAXON_ID=582737 /ORGANISM="Tetraselmis sp., Strain GSL018" /LENGTH=240 /DNA_ID=CAMNT_0019069359 /DNA_START=92 /DNA_END=814 /DNA_ORIENTATION=-
MVCWMPQVRALKPRNKISCMKHDDFFSDSDERLLLQFFKALNSEWKLCEACDETKYKLFTQAEYEGSATLSKAEVLVPVSVSVMIDFLYAQNNSFFDTMKILDSTCVEARVLEVLDPKHKVNIAKFETDTKRSISDKIWSDFSSMLPNGDAICLSSSTQKGHSLASWTGLGTTRGPLYTSGYYCEHIKGSENQCILHYVVQVEPCGRAPVASDRKRAADYARNVLAIAKHFYALQGCKST